MESLLSDSFLTRFLTASSNYTVFFFNSMVLYQELIFSESVEMLRQPEKP